MGVESVGEVVFDLLIEILLAAALGVGAAILLIKRSWWRYLILVGVLLIVISTVYKKGVMDVALVLLMLVVSFRFVRMKEELNVRKRAEYRYRFFVVAFIATALAIQVGYNRLYVSGPYGVDLIKSRVVDMSVSTVCDGDIDIETEKRDEVTIKAIGLKCRSSGDSVVMSAYSVQYSKGGKLMPISIDDKKLIDYYTSSILTGSGPLEAEEVFTRRIAGKPSWISRAGGGHYNMATIISENRIYIIRVDGDDMKFTENFFYRVLGTIDFQKD